MKTSAIVVFVGDPYLALTFYKSYKKFWDEEVDEIVVGISSKRDDMLDFIGEIWGKEPKARVLKIKNQYGYGSPDHGQTLDALAAMAKHEILMTIDSDFFILRKGVINEFKKKMNFHHVMGSTAGRICGENDLKLKFIKQAKYGRVCPWLSFWNMDMLRDLKFPTMQSVFVKRKGDIFEMCPLDGNQDRAAESEELWLETMGWLTYKVFTEKNNVSFEEIPSKSKSYFHMIGVSMGVRKYMKDMKTNLVFDRDHQSGFHSCSFLPSIYYNYMKNLKDYKNSDYYESILDLIERNKTTEEKLKEDKSNIHLDCIFS